jgi:hypothetical protein
VDSNSRGRCNDAQSAVSGVLPIGFEEMRDLERRIAKLEARQPRGLEALSDAELSARIDELMRALIAVEGHAAVRATVASKNPGLLEIFDEHAAKIGLGLHA